MDPFLLLPSLHFLPSTLRSHHLTMRDPLPTPAFLANPAIPLAKALSLRTLPLHTHEILPSFALYNILHIYVAPTISTRLFPRTYSSLPPRTKDNWNVHLVSLLQSTFISTLALGIMYLDKERRQMGPVQRVWGYTGAIGMVQSFSAGYFLWDLGVCVTDVGVHGWGALTHAAAALTVSLLGFRPFCNYYGLSFILYELSTPFLNIHWFLDKLHMTGSTFQLINGIILITTFAGSRLIWGTYQSVCMWRDLWAVGTRPGEGLPVPVWLAGVYVGATAVLGGLNFWWFGKMVKALRRRFERGGGGEREKKGNGKVL